MGGMPDSPTSMRPVPRSVDRRVSACGASLMGTKARLRPVLIELGGQIIKTRIVASDAEQSAHVSMRARDNGWSPYRVRFDETQAAWIVSSFDRVNPPSAH